VVSTEGGPAERSKPIVAEPQQTHAGGEVGAAERDRPRSLEALDDGSVPTRIRAHERLESLRGRGTGEIDVPFDREGDAVERWEIIATGDHTVSCFCGLKRLLAQRDRDGVDGGVHGLDPPEVGLDDFLTGHLPGSDGCGQLRGAHAPEYGGRDAHVNTPLRALLRGRRMAIAVMTVACESLLPRSPESAKGEPCAGDSQRSGGTQPRVLGGRLLAEGQGHDP
jgi:hypothetical protein